LSCAALVFVLQALFGLARLLQPSIIFIDEVRQKATRGSATTITCNAYHNAAERLT
jgi:ATP-dependent 26S proteasome regulatory subunit